MKKWFHNPNATGANNGTSPANAWTHKRYWTVARRFIQFVCLLFIVGCVTHLQRHPVDITDKARLVPKAMAVAGGYYDTNGCWHYKANGKYLVYCYSPHTNVVLFLYPIDATNYLWSLLASTDMKNWTVVVSNMVYNPSLTNWMDVKSTNSQQYWRMKGQKA